MGPLYDFLCENTPSPALLDPNHYKVDELLRDLEADLHLHLLARDPPPTLNATRREGVAWRNLTSYAEALTHRDRDPQAYNLALAMRWEEDRRKGGGVPLFRYHTPLEADDIMRTRSVERWRRGLERPDRNHLILIIHEDDGSFNRFNLNPKGTWMPLLDEKEQDMAKRVIGEVIQKHLNGAHPYLYVVNAEDVSIKYPIRDFLTFVEEVNRRSAEGSSRPIKDMEQYLEDRFPTPWYDALHDMSWSMLEVYNWMCSLCGKAKPAEETASMRVAEWVAKSIICQLDEKTTRSSEEMWNLFKATLEAARKEEVTQALDVIRSDEKRGIGAHGFLRVNEVVSKRLVDGVKKKVKPAK
jgi:hypothetical protein